MNKFADKCEDFSNFRNLFVNFKTKYFYKNFSRKNYGKS